MNKEERRLYNQQNYNKRKEWYKQWNKNHYQQNKEKIDKRHNLYKKSKKGKSVHIIAGWKRQGILCFDYELLVNSVIKPLHLHEIDIWITTILLMIDLM